MKSHRLKQTPFLRVCHEQAILLQVGGQCRNHSTSCTIAQVSGVVQVNIELKRPPNYDKIVAAFPGASEKGVIFTYGDTIYNPTGGAIPEWIVAHEEVHSEQQGLTVEEVEAWWDKYIEDVQFRFEQELPAHRREYQRFCELVSDRERRARMLHRIAIRLAGPLYGRMLPYIQARKVLKEVTKL